MEWEFGIQVVAVAAALLRLSTSPTLRAMVKAIFTRNGTSVVVRDDDGNVVIEDVSETEGTQRS